MQAHMTLSEKLNMAVKSVELENEGKLKEAHSVMQQIPLEPYLAKAVKDVYGAEYLGNSGYNLSEVEAEYGKDWLHK